MSKRRTYRVNADSWTVLRDILVGTPEPFNITRTATLWGTPVTVPEHAVPGRMTGYDAGLFNGHKAAGAITYVIYSYDTPIAYRVTTANAQTGEHTSKWIVPDTRYSVTTSKHQGRVRTAISQLGVLQTGSQP